jgi:hypothetical protein
MRGYSHIFIWAQMALALLVAISGPKKVSISGPTPPMDSARIKIIKSKLHINNRYIDNFMYMSFRSPPSNAPASPSWIGGGGGIA